MELLTTLLLYSSETKTRWRNLQVCARLPGIMVCGEFQSVARSNSKSQGQHSYGTAEKFKATEHSLTRPCPAVCASTRRPNTRRKQNQPENHTSKTVGLNSRSRDHNSNTCALGACAQRRNPSSSTRQYNGATAAATLGFCRFFQHLRTKWSRVSAAPTK